MSRINLDIVLGVLIGLAASILFASPWNWEHGLKDYQELVVGVLSLAGAAGAVIAVMRQVAHAQEMEDERLMRSMQSARTVMPQALSVLCAYAKDCGAALRETVNGVPPGDDHEWAELPPDRIPRIPESPIPILRECAQFGNSDLQLCIAKLSQTLQVQAARLSQLDEGGRNSAYFYNLVDDMLEVYARASSLFSYARMITDQAPSEPMLNDMRTAAFLCGFDLHHWEGLEDLLRHRYPAT